MPALAKDYEGNSKVTGRSIDVILSRGKAGAKDRTSVGWL